MTKTTKQAKSPARTYGESILPKVASKYMARRMASSIVESGENIEDFLLSPGSGGNAGKMLTLEMAGLMYLKSIFSAEFPLREKVLTACLPPLVDSGKYDDCIKAGEAGEEARDGVRHTLGVSCALMHEILGVYIHEISHRVAGESFGAKGEIAVSVFPEIKLIDEGYGVALNVRGGRCRFVATEMTDHQQAVINVAGYMGERLCPTLKDEKPNAPARDTEFWAETFAAIVAAGDPDKAEGEDANNPIFHSGSYQDATNFHANATTDEQREAAIEEASGIIVANWSEILAEATLRTLRHMLTLGECFNLITAAMKMAEGAACGDYIKTEGDDA